MLGKRDIRPEELPPAEDIKKLERRVASKKMRNPPQNFLRRNKIGNLWPYISFS